jgi:hypothetical protein
VAVTVARPMVTCDMDDVPHELQTEMERNGTLSRPCVNPKVFPGYTVDPSIPEDVIELRRGDGSVLGRIRLDGGRVVEQEWSDAPNEDGVLVTCYATAHDGEHRPRTDCIKPVAVVGEEE